MSADELKRVKQLQEAQALRLQKMEMAQQAQNARRQEYEPPEGYVETVEDVPPSEYNRVNNQDMLIDQLTQRITQQVTQNVANYQNVSKMADDRMQRLIDKYPAISQDDSVLTKAARDEVARISRENPSLTNDKATLFELAVETAASRIGARPVNTQYDPHQDFTLSAQGYNPAQKTKSSGHNFLTPKIMANYEVLAKSHPDFNMDPSTPQGQKNLKELNEYSERFRANVDESHLRFK